MSAPNTDEASPEGGMFRPCGLIFPRRTPGIYC